MFGRITQKHLGEIFRLTMSVMIMLNCSCSGDHRSEIATPTSTPAKPKPAAKKSKPKPESSSEAWIWQDYSADDYPTFVAKVESLTANSSKDLSNDLLKPLEERLVKAQEEMNALNAAANDEISSIAEPRELRVATYNLGLLCFTTFFLNQPNCDVRRAYLHQELGALLQADHRPDVLMLQEIWEEEDALTIMQIAEDFGYTIVNPVIPVAPELGSGLQILINTHRVGFVAIEETGFIKFNRALWEYVGHVSRGVLYAVINIDDRRFFVGNIHHTPDVPVPDFYQRDMQRRQLTDAMLKFKDSVDHIIVGGDFNYTAEFELANKLNVVDAQLGARTYIKFYEENHALGLVDSYRVTNEDAGYTFDKERNTLLQSSKLLGSRKRLDMIWVSRDRYPIYIKESHLLFDHPIQDINSEPLTWDDKAIFLSDHFGLYTTMMW